MAARVHGGTLGRWFEMLCRIEHPRLRDIVSARGTALQPRKLPAVGGVYCFWWTGDVKQLQSPECSRTIVLHGPNARPVELAFDDEWLGLHMNAPIPLYIGKTADSIVKRVGLHLTLKRERVIAVFHELRKQKRPTTSCQLRAGIDQLFQTLASTRDLVLDNVGLSYVCLDGDTHAANRFFLEDLAIGMMRPPLNIDIER